MENLDLLNVDLTGINLIEASAGTGKTFSIANLYLRLVLEQELPVQEILVVTFTDAATKELKERIRGNMLQAQKSLESGVFDDDDIVGAILSNYCENSSMEHAAKLLRRALLNIDEVAVFTIHGFCQRMLNENAFESKVAFDLELQTDDSQLVAEVVDDYWRKQSYVDGLETNADKNRRAELLALAQNFCANRSLILAGIDEIDDDVDQQLDDALSVVDKLSNRSEIVDLAKQLGNSDFVNSLKDHLFADASIFKASFKVADFPKYMTALAKGLSDYPHKNLGGITKLSTTKIDSFLKKNQTAPTHELFDFCQTLVDNAPDLKEAMATVVELKKKVKLRQQLAFIDYVRSEVVSRKQASRVQTFDDILVNLQNSLRSDDGSFHALIRNKFKVAMIDEFQDTDPVQYDIFHSIFMAEDSGLTLFMIGDPKQSIYAFRGADVFAYLNAKNCATGKYGLSTNYRSQKNMVDAVNHFFMQSESSTETVSAINPFVYGPSDQGEGINYHRVGAKGKDKKLLFDGVEEASLKLGYISSETDRPFNRVVSTKKTVQYVTNEIAYLLHSGSVKFADGETTQNVKPSDIAILTNNHAQAAQLHNSLSRIGVPCVLQKSGNILLSDEARQVQLLLAALLNPTERHIKALLTTDFSDATASQIFNDSAEDGHLLLHWVEVLTDLKKLWVSKSFIAMYRQMIRDSKLRVTTLAKHGGERSLTNFYHLGEIIHQATIENAFCAEALVEWFDRLLLDAESGDQEEYFMRLESDSDTVKIMTVHKSKGLEFNIVFCPFFGMRKFVESNRATGGFKFFRDGQEYYDLDSKSPNRQLWRKEQLAEHIRLIYVALTRAVNRCYLVTGDFSGIQETALNYLTNASRISGELELAQFINKPEAACDFGSISQTFSQDALVDVEDVTDKLTPKRYDNSDDVDHVELIPPQPFEREISKSWGIGSFSGLTRFAAHTSHTLEEKEAHLDDVNLAEAIPEIEKLPDDYRFFDFPRGATVGSAIHEMFENIDFSADPSTFNAVVEEKIRRFGLARGATDEAFNEDMTNKVDVVAEMVNNVVNASIPQIPNFTLSQLPTTNRLVEMAFYYQAIDISAERLQAIFSIYGVDISTGVFADRLGKLNFSLKDGFMTGFIDLIFEHDNKFYVLDWKTNHLGHSFANYSVEHLNESMIDSYYVLQYHLYIVALHLYLKQRLGASYSYEANMGGAVYAYVRGMHPDHPGKGVFYDRPSYELIAALSELFVEEK